jgi:hypothetical protein
MDEMSSIGKDLQLIFPLHLTDHEFFVEAVGPGEKEELGASAVEEFLAQVLEPGRPKGLGWC